MGAGSLATIRDYALNKMQVVIGFLFLPTTTLAFSYSMNSLGEAGAMTPLGWLLTVIGLVVDLGLHGSGARRVRRVERIQRVED